MCIKLDYHHSQKWMCTTKLEDKTKTQEFHYRYTQSNIAYQSNNSLQKELSPFSSTYYH